MPLSLVDSASFRFFCSAISDRKFQSPGRTKFSSLIEQLSNTVSHHLFSILQDIPGIGLTTDGTTLLGARKFVALTGHFIYEWKIYSIYLALVEVDGPEDSEYLSELLESLLKLWSIKSPQFIVTDNGANFVSCADKLRAKHVISDHIRCACHTIQLSVDDVVKKCAAIKDVIEHCRLIASTFRNSPTLTSAFEHLQEKYKQQHPDYKPLVLQKDVVTRWNSTETMLKSLLHNREVLKRAAEDINKPEITMDDHEWQVVSELQILLEKLTEATVTLEAEKYPTLGFVIPVIYALYYVLESMIISTNEVTEARQALLESLRRRWDTIDTTLLVAMILDPRFKHLPWLSDRQAYLVKEELRMRTNSLLQDPEDRKDAVEASSNSNAASNRNSLTSILTSKCQVQARDEFEEYFACANINWSDDPLIWWNANECKFPRISKLARIYLCTPASNAPSERLFSSASYILRDKRNRLNSSSVEHLVMLRKNLPVVQSILNTQFLISQ